MFDEQAENFAWARDELRQLLDEREYAAAARTTINAHYTDAALVKAIWEGVYKLGWTGGRVLEPGCGSGNFIGLGPDNAEWVGVELDPTTAAIATALYPHADIRAESFAHTRAREGTFDAVVGNVPFGDIRLHDPRHNPGNHTIHNHFIIKSLRLTRPGGLVVVITSAYTMDAANPAARREMQQLADLVGAVRLPSKAHARAAGTDALTDVLIFRRREDDRPPAPFDWEYTRPVQVGEATVRVNAYFLDRPERVLGEFASGDGLYRADELSVVGDPDAAPQQLAAVLDEIAAEAHKAGLTMTPPDPTRPVSRAAVLPPAGRNRRPLGYLESLPDGTFTREDEYGPEPYSPPKTQAAELRALLRLRDTALKLLEAEASSIDDTDEVNDLREQLNRHYDAYVRQYGPLNRFTWREQRRRDPVTGKSQPVIDEQTGQPKMMRIRPGQGGFRHDPFASLVYALEIFNEETQTATKADIFRQRVVYQRPPRLGADSPADALAIVRDEYGEVRLDKIAWLLGVDEAEARQALGTLVYDDPVTGRLEPASAYLSGNVRAKLAAARAAADEDPRYQVNVEALETVLPRDLGPDEIVVSMGAPWIDAHYVEQFLREILEDDSVTVEHAGGSIWSVDGNQNTVAATSVWGTDRMPAHQIAQRILEQRTIKVVDVIEVDGREKRITNLDATVAANEKADEMRERFAEWLWEDPERTATLVRKYNDLFNSHVLRNYDDVQLSLPGLSMARKPRPHQIAAVARILAEPGVGLYHCVGAGKTMTMIMAVMEMRRLGLVRKPMIVVPNHMLEQFAREFHQTYPQARILAAGKEDLAGEKRRQLVARMATGDWDAIIMTEAGFLRLPMSPKAQERYIERQTQQLRDMLIRAGANGQKKSVKRLEAMLARREAKIEKKIDTKKDEGIWFELTGVDFIVRDEADRDKNLQMHSNLEGMSIEGSARAEHMSMVLDYLRQKHNRWTVRATGTPISNSMVEIFTEFSYNRPDLLEQAGITDLDSFLATFAQPVTAIEVAPDGGGLRTKTRLAKFHNVPDLIRLFHQFADVKTADDLNLPRPQLAQREDGQRVPELIVVPPSPELLARVAEHVKRAEAARGRNPQKGADNILKITGEARRDALDLRINGGHTDWPQKVDVSADKIAEIWRENRDRIYLGPDGQPHPTPGALQLVFCDEGTPGKDKEWNVYDELRDQLVARGIPREQIRFIHEAKNDRQKFEMFQAARDGRIAVLIGSTEKMGAGTNVQDRAIALHHLDPQWRPRDIEQREGRILRQGNQNPEIRILRYVTERSFDAYMWQTVSRKSKFIDQILRGHYEGREAEDLGDGSLSYEEMKAAATGNPLLIDHAVAKAALTRLERLERAYQRNRKQLEWTIRNAEQEIAISQARVREADDALRRRVDTRGDAFVMTVAGKQHTKRSEANHQLRALLIAHLDAGPGSTITLGEISSFPITATVEVEQAYRNGLRQSVRLVRVRLVDCPGAEIAIYNQDVGDADIVTRLENRLQRLESVRASAQRDIERWQAEASRARQELTKPFRYADALVEARRTFMALDAQLAELVEQEERAAAEASSGNQEITPTPTAVPTGRWQASNSPITEHNPAPSTSSTVYPGQPSQPSSTVAGETTVPEQFAPVAEVVDELLDWACNDVQLLAACRANPLDDIRTVVAERIESRVLDAHAAAADQQLDTFVRIYLGPDPAAKAALDAYLAQKLYAYATTPAGLDSDTVPELWAVTYRAADGRPPTTVLIDRAEVDASVTKALRDGGPGRVSRHEHKVTIRGATGDATMCAEPADLPWRGWRPKEADTLHLGRGPLWCYEPGQSSGSERSLSDLRDLLRQAQDAGSPVAVTDWGVVTVCDRGPVVVVRDGARLPEVAEVPAENLASTASTPAVLTPAATVEPPEVTAPRLETGHGTPQPADQAPTSTGSEPDEPVVADRIRLEEKEGSVKVVGTTGHPREAKLRALLKEAGFRYSRETKEWSLRGRTDRVVAEVRAAIDELNRQKTSTAAPVKVSPTPQQQAIIDAYLEGKHVVVQALAGTGKTSTLQMLAHVRPEARIAYVAFNASIAAEAQGKFPANVTAKTSHAFAKAALRDGPLSAKVNRVGEGERWPDGWARVLGISDVVHRDEVIEADTQARWVMHTVRKFRESADDEIRAAHLPEGLREPSMASLAAAVLEYARRAWEDISDPDGQLLFDHDDYLKLWALSKPRLGYDVIFFDEAQDINDVLRKVIQDQPAQTVVVGDSNQSIYGFRGAINALDRWPADVTLPLTQSWRFGPAIAEVGNDFLKLLNSPYQLAGNPGLDSRVGTVGKPDAVLARTNAGAVAAVFDGFDDGLDVALIGGGKMIRDIAQAALDLQAGRGTKHPELARFANWQEVQEYVEEDEHAQSLRAFVRLVDRRGAKALIGMADRLIDEKATRPDGSPAYDLVVSTAHKSKGLEWEKVRIADDFPQPQVTEDGQRVTLPHPEELRLAYVAVTRARKEVDLGSLSWIQDKELVQTAMQQRRARPQQPATTVAAQPMVSDPQLSAPHPTSGQDEQPNRKAEAVASVPEHANLAQAHDGQPAASELPAEPEAAATDTATSDDQPAEAQAIQHTVDKTPTSGGQVDIASVDDAGLHDVVLVDPDPLLAEARRVLSTAEPGADIRRPREQLTLFTGLAPAHDQTTQRETAQPETETAQLETAAPAPGSDDKPEHEPTAGSQQTKAVVEDPFSPVERVLIAYACEDYAGNWYGRQGGFEFGLDDCARYVSEGHLGELVKRHGLEAVWKAVRLHLVKHPEILEAGRLTDEQRRHKQEARAAAAQEKARAANREYKAGNFQRALQLLDEAELASPTFRPAGRWSWDELRSLVGNAQAASEAATGIVPATAEPQPAATADSPAAQEPANTAPSSERPVPTPAESTVAAFELVRDGQPRQAVTRDEALALFSEMISRAEAGAQAAGSLYYRGAYISVGRSSDRLRIAVGTRRQHQNIPLKHPWPPQHLHARIFDKIVAHLDKRADNTRTVEAKDMAARLRKLHSVAARHRPGMSYQPNGGAPEPISDPAAVDQFRGLLDEVRRTGSASGRLIWRGVAIGLHRIDGPQPRLGITLGVLSDHVEIPSRPWPTADEADLLRWIVRHIDTAGQAANRLALQARSMDTRTPRAGKAFPAPPCVASSGSTVAIHNHDVSQRGRMTGQVR